MTAPAPNDPWTAASGPVEGGLAVTALGGGHGLAVTLRALRTFCSDLTAVVTVADNGGSSGRLRHELGVLPPGDLRQALAALCRDDEWGRTWASVLQHRFAGAGPLQDHAMGNLLIVALWDLLEGHVEGLDWVGRLLGAEGRVLPMAAVPLDISARVRGADPGRPDDVTVVWGQVQVATTSGRVESVELVPGNPPACPEALEAIHAADWVVLGPGSWYTSVLPHLLVPELLGALVKSPAKRCVTLNVAPQPGETDGFDSSTYLEVLAAHAPELQIDVVVADLSQVPDSRVLEGMVNALGGRLVVADIAAHDGTSRHDAARLAATYAGIMA
jgi:uncharacterized cofD-like protein